MEYHDSRWSQTHEAVKKMGARLAKLSQAHDKTVARMSMMLDEDADGIKEGRGAVHSPEEYDVLNTKVDEALGKFRKAKREETDKAWKEIKKRNKDVIKNVQFKREGLDNFLHKVVDQVSWRLDGAISERLQQWVDETIIRSIPKNVKERRAYFKGTRHGELDQGVYLPTGVTPETVAHELGHSLETNANIHAAAHGFLYHRVGKEPAKPMGGGFGQLEVGRGDEFGAVFGRDARYVGKHYKTEDTEIVSMGLEKMFSDPVHFAEADREYFKFMLGILDGSFT